MNPDDPKLTAYALGELDEPERAEIEALLREDPAAAAEVAALREFTARLRTELHDEKAPGLTEDQRAGVFAAARGGIGEPSGGGGGAPPEVEREESASPVTNHFRTWLAMAAVAAAAATIATFWIKTGAKMRELGNTAVIAKNDSSKLSENERTLEFSALPTQKVSADAPIRTAVAVGKEPVQLADQPATATAQSSAPTALGRVMNAPAGGAGTAQLEERDKLTLSSPAAATALPSLQPAEPTASANYFTDQPTAKEEFGSRYALAYENRTRGGGARGTGGSDSGAVVALKQGLDSGLEGKKPADDESLAETSAKTALGVSADKSAAAPAKPATLLTDAAEPRAAGGRRMAPASKDAPTPPSAAAPASDKSIALYKQIQRADSESAPGAALAPAVPAPPAETQRETGRALVATAAAPRAAVRLESRKSDFVSVSTQPFAAIPLENQAVSAGLEALSTDGASSVDTLRATYAYRGTAAQSAEPIAVALEVAACPWAPEHRLLEVRLAVQNEAAGRKEAKELTNTKGILDAQSAEAPGPKDVKLQIEFNPAQASAYRLVKPKEAAANTSTLAASATRDLKAGQGVTALYEIIPAAQPAGAREHAFANSTKRSLDLADLDRAKEETADRKKDAEKPAAAKSEDGAIRANELLTVNLAWTDPTSGGRQTKIFPLRDSGRTLPESSPEFRWSAAVANFGLLLENSPEKGRATWAEALKFGEEAKGKDADGGREKFLEKMEKASQSTTTKAK